MSISTTSVQFNASYSSVSHTTRPAVLGAHAFDNAVNITDSVEIGKAAWEDLVGLQTTDTVAEDGTITRTMTGGVSFLGAARGGSTSFGVSLTFDPDTYEGGELGAAADLLAAAHAAEKAALRDALSGSERDQQLQRLDVVYQKQKTEVSISFSKMVSGYLEFCSGTGEEEQKVYDSVQALFTRYEEKYQAVLGENALSVRESKSLFEAAVSLQRLGTSFPVTGGGAKGLYSLQELESAAMRVCKGFSITG